MNSPSHDQPDYSRMPREIDKTYVEGMPGNPTGFTNFQPGTRINATAYPSVNPYTQTGAGRYQSPADALPTGNDPIPLGSGTVVGLLGSGGMAKVYKVWNEKLEVFRAVKILLPTQQADLKNRFETEAKITAKLHHPNIVEIYGVGDWNGLPYLEMEYIEGVSLESFISTNEKLPDIVCSSISILVARALEYAHSQEFLIYGKTYHGVIHRDLKPANIMIPSIGDVRLMDFGIARPTEASLHTVEGNIVGTMQYLSPEQLDGIDIDARSDIYSFGTILYEMLTGTKTFPQDTITNLMKKKIMNEYRKFSDFDFPVSNQLGKIAQKCLQINKTDRFPSTSALLAELESAHRSLTSESPSKVLQRFINDPESVKSTSRRGIKVHIPAKILIPVLGITGIAALVTVFLITGPTGDTASDQESSSPDTVKQVRRDTVRAPIPPVAPDPEVVATVEVPEKPYKRPERPTPTYEKPSYKRPTPKPDGAITKTPAPPPPPAIDKPEVKQPDVALSPLETLKKTYNSDDLFTVGKSALKAREYSDAIFALENVPAGQGDNVTKNLLLFDAYLQTGKLGEALVIANNESINDAQFDYLCGRLYEMTSKNKRALGYYQTALTKPSVIRSRDEIRNDALFQTAVLWSSEHHENPTPDSRIQALNAWNTVKRTYMATPNHARFKKANSELASIQ